MTFIEQAQAARQASRSLAGTSGRERAKALEAMADALLEPILEANGRDLAAATDQSEAMRDRLRLDETRVASMAAGLRSLASLPDVLGDVVRGWVTETGLRIEQRRVPIGVLGIIYEARPNVTADAAGICIKSGNAVLLRGSSTAEHSNMAITSALQKGLAAVGFEPECVQLVLGDRSVTGQMMRARGLIDCLIPRGGAGLIQAVVTEAQVPVIETGTGNCHLYLDASADLDMGLAILRNAKTSRPSVCNACETVLVHADIAAEAIPRIMQMAEADNVTVHAEPGFARYAPSALPAASDEFDAEYLSLDLAAKVVPSLEAAIEHIREHTSGHSETIVSSDVNAIAAFTEQVDAAAVLVNASSRFVDGGEFGFGAEIGISTQKLHARGPMGLAEMTTTKYIVTGSGHVRD